MNKVVYVKAHFRPERKQKTVKVATGEKKKGFFGGDKEVTKNETQWVETGGASDCEIDGERLAAEIEAAINTLNNEGYEVVDISQVVSGRYNFDTKSDTKWKIDTGPRPFAGGWGWGWGYGYGFSYTEGVTIIARKVA